MTEILRVMEFWSVRQLPFEKYEFVSWDDEIPTEWKNNSHVPNYPPESPELPFRKTHGEEILGKLRKNTSRNGGLSLRGGGSKSLSRRRAMFQSGRQTVTCGLREDVPKQPSFYLVGTSNQPIRTYTSQCCSIIPGWIKHHKNMLQGTKTYGTILITYS